MPKQYDDGYLLWIADLSVKKLQKERELEFNVEQLKLHSGLVNVYNDECFLQDIRQSYYDLEKIEEELVLARQQRAVHLKTCPTREFISVYGDCINNTPGELEE